MGKRNTGIVLAKRKPLQGVGINDANYKTTTCERIDGVLVRTFICPYYAVWSDMLMRCYSTKYQEKCPTYKGASVCEEWLIFSNFKSWMETQDWEGKELDKDILIEGNNIYSAETCLFIPSEVNQLIAHMSTTRIGVRKVGNRWVARISIKRKEISKSFLTYEEAKNHWIDLQSERIKNMLCKYVDSKEIVHRLSELLHRLRSI